jgi:hypothetical protein
MKYSYKCIDIQYLHEDFIAKTIKEEADDGWEPVSHSVKKSGHMSVMLRKEQQ